MAVWNLTDGLGLISVFIKVFEGTDARKRRIETTGQTVVRVFAGYEEILKEKYRSLSRQTSVLDFFKLHSTLLYPQLYRGTLELMTRLTCLQNEKKFSFLKFPFVCQSSYFFKIFLQYYYLSFSSREEFFWTPLPIVSLRLQENLSLSLSLSLSLCLD
jgi:hypothetical protein